MIRIGHGMDVHKLVEGRKLILCGVEVPHSLGLLGHSDADVATHALMDALLGAAALGDIGKLFPDTDERYRGADSLVLLKAVMACLKENGFSLCNADVTIVAQRPKLRPYIDDMRARLAAVLTVPLSQVSVKATTTEELGFEGQGLGITAHAVCLITSA
ncbi:MAG: 2-C-methyl-D-erythritol 2,4-cyclodiphosphate synthase [Clostridia bacterium]